MKNMITGSNNIRDHNHNVASYALSNSDFNNLMNYFWNYMDFPLSTWDAKNSVLEPKLQIAETKDAVNITVEIPGINENDLELKISADGYLSLAGEKKNSMSADDKNSYFSEISYGSFRRTIPLPWDLDFDKAAATYHNGILNVSIPVSQVEKQKFKKIAINTTNKN